MQLRQRGWRITGWAKLHKTSMELRKYEDGAVFYDFKISDAMAPTTGSEMSAYASNDVARLIASLRDGDWFYFDGVVEHRTFNRRDTGELASYRRVRVENVYVPRDREPDWNGETVEFSDELEEVTEEDPFLVG